MWILLAVLIFVFFASFGIGKYSVPIGELFKIFFSRIIPIPQTWTIQMERIVFNIRIPRIILACLVGCCLSAAGASYQGVFQNPMAAPDILGASSGAAFGAALAIILNCSSRIVLTIFGKKIEMPGLITLFAFFFSLISVAIVFFVGSRTKGKKVVTLILAGIMVSSLFSAGTSLIKLLADQNDQLPAITYWLMGSLNAAKMEDVLWGLIPMVIGLVPLLLLRWRLNILTLGDEEARAMGVNANLLRLVVVLAATLVTAASVSLSGMIGWVGLVIPHMCRKMVGNNYRYLMPATMIFGATFLLIVDNIARNLFLTDLPIGILTAFIGAPFFIYLITKRKEQPL